jgi:hypothetical protein
MASISFKSFIEMDYDALDANIILNKFTDEIKAKLESIVAAGRIPELAAYNDMIVTYIVKNIKTKLSQKQSDNLLEYAALSPKELVGDFWTKFNADSKEISEDWYSRDLKGAKRVAKVIMEALVNPNAKKKAAVAV